MVCFMICLFISPDLDGHRAPKNGSLTLRDQYRSHIPNTKPPRYVLIEVYQINLFWMTQLDPERCTAEAQGQPIGARRTAARDAGLFRHTTARRVSKRLAACILGQARLDGVFHMSRMEKSQAETIESKNSCYFDRWI